MLLLQDVSVNNREAEHVRQVIISPWVPVDVMMALTKSSYSIHHYYQPFPDCVLY